MACLAEKIADKMGIDSEKAYVLGLLHDIGRRNGKMEARHALEGYLFLFSKHGYKPIGNAVELVNTWFEKGYEIYLCSYVHKTRFNFIKYCFSADSNEYGMYSTDC